MSVETFSCTHNTTLLRLLQFGPELACNPGGVVCQENVIVGLKNRDRFFELPNIRESQEVAYLGRCLDFVAGDALHKSIIGLIHIDGLDREQFCNSSMSPDILSRSLKQFECFLVLQFALLVYEANLDCEVHDRLDRVGIDLLKPVDDSAAFH